MILLLDFAPRSGASATYQFDRLKLKEKGKVVVMILWLCLSLPFGKVRWKVGRNVYSKGEEVEDPEGRETLKRAGSSRNA